MKRTQRLALTLEAASAGAAAFRYNMRNGLLRGPLGRRLWRGATGPLSFTYPPPLRPGHAGRGEAWLGGNFTLPGGIVRGAGQSPFLLTAPHEEWTAALHGFDWLADLLAAPDGRGRDLARDMILHWVQSDFIIRRAPMQPAVVGQRLARWAHGLSALQTGFDSQDMLRIGQSYTHQARWLMQTVQQIPDSLARLQALTGLTLAGLAMLQEGQILRQAMDLLVRELRRQILPDGGHVSRAPSALVAILADLIAIESGLANRQIAPPTQFTITLTRVQGMIAMLRHQDGKLAVFHGGLESDTAQIEAILPKKPPTPMSFAQKSGYQRLSAGQSCLLVDIGNGLTGPHSVSAHAAPLAFEMSHGSDRLIVNCGPNLVHGADWRIASRGLSAHSSLAFASDITDPFMRQGAAARRLGPRLKPDDWHLTSRRAEDKSGIWLETSHGIFLDTHGVRHNRRFFIDARGEDIRGEDLLLADMTHRPREGAAFHLRFHLHPDVTATVQSGGDAVLLMSPSGHGWQFRFGLDEHYTMQLEDSVYMGQNGVPQRAQQIALRGQLAHSDTLIRWALRYAGKSNKRRAARG
ncbi:MAG: heparinase II/III family protein [Parvibaculales bacterium]